jgi:uncharacterized MAPEG superfamily protein
MPYALIGFAKSGSKVDNRDPRATDYQGIYRRAFAAHQNAFEAFPFFAAAVIIAVTQGAPLGTVNTLAVLYVVMRIAHAGCYLADLALPRSAGWGVAMLLNIAILVSPVWR